MPQQRIEPGRRIGKKRKQRIRIAVLGLAAAFLLFALALFILDSDEQPETDGEQTSAMVPTNGNGPQLAVDRTEIDHGEVAYNQPVDAVYRLTNVGDEVLVIDEPSIETLEGC